MPGTPHIETQLVQFSLALTCRKCGQNGTSIWEGDISAASAATHANLVSLSGEFYERIGRKRPHLVEMVCNRCETVHLAD